MSPIVEAVREEFRRRYRREPKVAIAPGRVNLIGEHTDYNEGFVLPVAIDRYCALAFAGNEDGVLRGYSVLERDERQLPLDALSPSSDRSWFDYAAGVLWAHREAPVAIDGMDFVVGSDLPIGAGLSSSAAFELAVARALIELGSGLWDGAEEARLAQRAENEFVGMPCGIMDQMAASVSREGSAMLLDCRSLDVESVPLPDEVLIAVCDTGTRRKLTASAYQERRRSCERAASALAVRSLRDASLELLDEKKNVLSETTYRRALHVVTENERTREMASALGRADRENIGRLMKDSHESLRLLFEVSSPALDRMAEIARRQTVTLGARMTGAGFGGSVVALVEARAAEGFARELEACYRSETGLEGRVILSHAVGGARIVE